MQNKWIAFPLSIVLVFGMSTAVFAAPSSNANMNATQKTIATQKNITTETVATSSFYDEDGYNMQAPGIAARILKYNDVKNHYGQGKTGGNFIADVAAEMGRNGQFSGITNDAPDMAYVNAVLLFLNNHPNMEKELVLPIDIIEVGNVVAEDFGVMNQSNVLGYTVGFGLVDATAADVEDINIALYNGTTLLGTVDSEGVQENYPTATSLSAPFDVLGTFDYEADGNWNYSGWNTDHTVVPTKAVITVTFENGLVKTAINENLTGNTSLIVLHTSNVVAEDFGVMNQSNVLGYTVGFGLVDATAADVEDINIALYNGTTLLGTVDSDGVQENYPTATSLSAPFDVLGTFDYEADGNWNYSGWNADHIVVPTKAVITVTFENGLVKTAINENLTGDTSLVVVHTSNVVAEDFGVMDQSNVLGYTFGFGLVDATAADVEDISITLFHDTTPLGTVTSDGVQANYPTATSLSAPFDVLGTFDYVADGNWDYTGWNVSHTMIPTRAVITVIFENGLVKTATSVILTGDTTLITE